MKCTACGEGLEDAFTHTYQVFEYPPEDPLGDGESFEFCCIACLAKHVVAVLAAEWVEGGPVPFGGGDGGQ